MQSEVRAILADMHSSRLQAVTDLAGLTEEHLTRPAQWGGRELDLRFILLRFAHHELEHTTQILKWRQQVERLHTGAQRLLGNARSSRGVLEGHLLGLPTTCSTANQPAATARSARRWHTSSRRTMF